MNEKIERALDCAECAMPYSKALCIYQSDIDDIRHELTVKDGMIEMIHQDLCRHGGIMTISEYRFIMEKKVED